MLRNLESPNRLSLRVVGGALSATLVALYVGCFLSVLFLPMLPLSHSWLGLFTAAWPMSIAGLIQGVAINLFIGWFAATVYVLTHNWLMRRKIDT
jgi:hypothetical protein